MISETRSVTHPGNYTRPIGRILVRQVLRSLKSTNQSGGGGGGGGGGVGPGISQVAHGMKVAILVYQINEMGVNLLY